MLRSRCNLAFLIRLSGLRERLTPLALMAMERPSRPRPSIQDA
jgi:hypothetical protein